MKQLFTLSVILLLSFKSNACTCDPAYEARGFCEVIHASQNKPMFCVVQGRVVDWYEYGAHIEILQNIYGQASNDTIILWGDMGACCRPSFAGYAQILPGDTLVMALEQTDLCGNWIAPGMPDFEDTMDYVLQGCGAYYMRYHNGQVVGMYESGTFQNDTMSYAALLAQIQECVTPTAVSHTEANNTTNIFPNPANDILHITSVNTIAGIELFNALGQCLYTNTPNTRTTDIDLTSIPAGIYTILLYDKDNNLITRKKLVRQ